MTNNNTREFARKWADVDDGYVMAGSFEPATQDSEPQVKVTQIIVDVHQDSAGNIPVGTDEYLLSRVDERALTTAGMSSPDTNIEGAPVTEQGMDIIVRNAGIDDKPILRQLLELYEYDFSEYTNDDIGPLGFYGYRYLDHYWTDDDRHPYLVHANGHIAGFALVNRHPVDGEEPAWSMAEFFILRKYRSKGIGETVATEIFDQWPGRWQVTQLSCHPGATAFWRKVIDRYTNGDYEEREARWGSETGVVQFFESRAQSS